MRLLLSFLLMTGTVLVPAAPASSQGSTGHIKGEIWYRPFVDSDSSFENVTVSSCEVVFRSGSSPKKIVSSGDGHFAVDLPAGIYNATTNCSTTPTSWEYHPAIRPDFEVKSGSNALLNFMTPVKYSRAGKARDGKDQLEYKSGDLKNEYLQSKTASGQVRKILVRYLRRASSKELAEYEGRRDYRQNAPASVSFDLLSIYADSITIEKPKMHVRAVGHVIVEDGKQRRQGNEATVEFDAADPVSTLEILGSR